MIILADQNNRINISYDGREYSYTKDSIKDIFTESIESLQVSDEPLEYVYRLHIRDSLLPNFMLYMPDKHILMLNERINYFT